MNNQITTTTLAGDGEIRARVSSFQNTGSSGRVGVMMRDSLTSLAMNTFMGVQSSNGTFYSQCRTSTGGSTTSTSSGTGTAPNVWVRLVRTGNSVVSYKSADGSNWTAVNTNSVIMSTNCYFGLVVASGTTNALNTSTFDNLMVAP